MAEQKQIITPDIGTPFSAVTVREPYISEELHILGRMFIGIWRYLKEYNFIKNIENYNCIENITHDYLLNTCNKFNLNQSVHQYFGIKIQ